MIKEKIEVKDEEYYFSDASAGTQMEDLGGRIQIVEASQSDSQSELDSEAADIESILTDIPNYYSKSKADSIFSTPDQLDSVLGYSERDGDQVNFYDSEDKNQLLFSLTLPDPKNSPVRYSFSSDGKLFKISESDGDVQEVVFPTDWTEEQIRALISGYGYTDFTDDDLSSLIDEYGYVQFSGSYNDLTGAPDIPTEDVLTDWGFSKTIGTYSKPDDGIPESDLTSDISGMINGTVIDEKYVHTDSCYTDDEKVKLANVAEGATNTQAFTNYNSGDLLGRINDTALYAPSLPEPVRIYGTAHWDTNQWHYAVKYGNLLFVHFAIKFTKDITSDCPLLLTFSSDDVTFAEKFLMCIYLDQSAVGAGTLLEPMKYQTFYASKDNRGIFSASPYFGSTKIYADEAYDFMCIIPVE